MAKPLILHFPPEYPELLEQMGQIIGRKLLELDVPSEKASHAAFDIVESVRNEIGGVQLYIPRGMRFELSRRDHEIYNKFNGRNYHNLAREYGLSEMQIRNIVKRILCAQTHRQIAPPIGEA